jgi:hypothetical protein
MKRKRFILLLMVIFALQPVCVSAQVVTRTITDIENGMPVPYATIYKSDNVLICSANIDGVFSINVTPSSLYKISRIGYESISLTDEQLLLNEVIKMKILPYELNAVVVTADAALSGIQRALDSTHRHIPSPPFFQRCYKKEVIVSENDTILNAKAIMDFRITKIHATGNGFRCIPKLKGLHIDYNNSGSEDIIPLVNVSSIIPINSGYTEKEEKNIIFTRINSDNDSITIISFHPKNYYSSKEVAYTSGRFIIDTKTWCILRIDAFLDNSSTEYFNHLVKTSNTKQKVMREHSLSFFYTNCLPSKVEQKTVYCLKDKPDELFTWTVLQVYKDLTKAEFNKRPSASYKPEKFILQQKPVTMPDFESKFNQGFQ